ncbi:hypothetical protein [Mucilaginibacter sp.]|jgi:hypothetical protein|uniref:hypothetical protein n=1 Tax=Mucilaginibacter sp. TaxID=1882438 RepID=UPI002CF604A0|nr:hypothetical protein [Mucilaginibacter sp.]HTI61050.1 hypothetical protein [Mucilaginibacter sp.]
MNTKPILEMLRFNLKGSFLFLSAFIGLMCLFISCDQINSPKRIEPVKIRPAIQTIVDSIAKYNQLTSSGVGFAGVRTGQWNRYEKLNKVASLAELRELTHHKNSVVRCYAYDALTARKDTYAFTLLLSHLHDTAKVSTFFGCIISEEMAGDYFLNAVTPHNSTDVGYKLSLRQKSMIDSILLFDKHIILSAKYNLLYDLKPQAQYYNRIREIAINEKMPVAIWALAKYERVNDVSIIRAAFNDLQSEDYAIRSAMLIPDNSFYPIITNIFEREWKEKLYDYQKWEILYQALAQYPKEPQTLDFFKKTIQTKDEFRYKTLGADLLIAITKYPDPVFEPLKKQIKLDKYSMEDVNRALSKTE